MFGIYRGIMLPTYLDKFAENPATVQKMSHRQTAKNAERTKEILEEYHGVVALLNTWEAQPDDVQADNHEYILELRRRARNVRNYINHRADPQANV